MRNHAAGAAAAAVLYSVPKLQDDLNNIGLPAGSLYVRPSEAHNFARLANEWEGPLRPGESARDWIENAEARASCPTSSVHTARGGRADSAFCPSPADVVERASGSTWERAPPLATPLDAAERRCRREAPFGQRDPVYAGRVRAPSNLPTHLLSVSVSVYVRTCLCS